MDEVSTSHKENKMKINITIEGATPEELQSMLIGLSARKTLETNRMCACTAADPIQCDGPSADAPYDAPTHLSEAQTASQAGIVPPKRRIRKEKIDEKKEESVKDAPTTVVQAPTPSAPLNEDPKPAAEVKTEEPKEESKEEPKTETLAPVSVDSLRTQMKILYLSGANGAAASTRLLADFGVKKIAELREDQTGAFSAAINRELQALQGKTNA